MGQAGSQPTPVPPPPQSNQPVKPQLPSGPSENKPESSNAPSGAFFTRNTRWDDNKVGKYNKKNRLIWAIYRFRQLFVLLGRGLGSYKL